MIQLFSNTDVTLTLSQGFCTLVQSTQNEGPFGLKIDITDEPGHGIQESQAEPSSEIYNTPDVNWFSPPFPTASAISSLVSESTDEDTATEVNSASNALFLKIIVYLILFDEGVE